MFENFKHYWHFEDFFVSWSGGRMGRLLTGRLSYIIFEWSFFPSSILHIHDHIYCFELVEWILLAVLISKTRCIDCSYLCFDFFNILYCIIVLYGLSLIIVTLFYLLKWRSMMHTSDTSKVVVTVIDFLLIHRTLCLYAPRHFREYCNKKCFEHVNASARSSCIICGGPAPLSVMQGQTICLQFLKWFNNILLFKNQHINP